MCIVVYRIIFKNFEFITYSSKSAIMNFNTLLLIFNFLGRKITYFIVQNIRDQCVLSLKNVV